MELVDLNDADHALLLALAVGLMWTLTYLATRLLAAQPEPTADPDFELKTPYAQLVTRKFTVSCLVISTCCALALLVTPPASWPLWIVFGSLVLVLVACDAVTTWLPIGLTKICWAAMALAVPWSMMLNQWVFADQGFGTWLNVLLGTVLGSTATAGLFWLIWRFVGQLGFGDVRLAWLTGAISGAHGFDMWAAALFLGTLAAAIWGLVTAALRRRKPSPLGSVFAYGPGLWLGPYLAVVVILAL